MRLNYKMLMWIAIATVGMGSVNSFASHIGIVVEQTAVFTKQNGVQETLQTGSEVQVELDEGFHQSEVIKVQVNGTYGHVNKSDIHMKQIETKILEDGTNLRKEPNLKSAIITRLSKSTVVIAYYKHDEWYYVERGDGARGFVHQAYIDEENLYLLDRKDIRTVNALMGEGAVKTALQLRPAASASSAAAERSKEAIDNPFDLEDVIWRKRENIDHEASENIAAVKSKTAELLAENASRLTLLSGDRIKVILDEDFHYNDIAQVDMNGTYGYIEKRNIQMKQIQARVLTDGTLLRRNPSSASEVVRRLAKDDLVTVYYRYIDWYFAESENGQQGFIYKTQIDEEYLYLLKQKSELSQTQPISPGKTSQVEVVMWSEAAKILPRGGNAIIEDVYTGKRFGIKRTFGSNHADVETLTKADTEIMKEIWGGFSWERRPVIVHVAGRRLAASLAGMPHAGKDSAPNIAYTSNRSAGYGYGINLDAVKGNGMDGHIDLHFRGSRRHADGKIKATVDAKHQAAIDVAARQK